MLAEQNPQALPEVPGLTSVLLHPAASLCLRALALCPGTTCLCLEFFSYLVPLIQRQSLWTPSPPTLYPEAAGLSGPKRPFPLQDFHSRGGHACTHARGSQGITLGVGPLVPCTFCLRQGPLLAWDLVTMWLRTPPPPSISVQGPASVHPSTWWLCVFLGLELRS